MYYDYFSLLILHVGINKLAIDINNRILHEYCHVILKSTSKSIKLVT